MAVTGPCPWLPPTLYAFCISKSSGEPVCKLVASLLNSSSSTFFASASPSRISVEKCLCRQSRSTLPCS